MNKRPAKVDQVRPNQMKHWRWFVLSGIFILAVGAVVIRQTDEVKPAPTVTDIPYVAPETVEVTTEEVRGVSDFTDSRLVLAEREVVAVDERGENQYQTHLRLSDFTGAKRLTFVDINDLTYEPLALFGSQRVAAFPEDSAEPGRVYYFDGRSETFNLPPYRYGGFLVNADESWLAFVRGSGESGVGSDELVVRRLSDNSERVVRNDAFSIDNLIYQSLSPLAFDPAGSTLYVKASVDQSDPGSAYGLFRVVVDSGTVTLVLDEPAGEAGQYRNLIGVFPDLGFGLAEKMDAGSFDEVENSYPNLRVEKFSLAGGEFQPWLERAGVSLPILAAGSPIRPDGGAVALESADPNIAGVIVWEIETDTFSRLSDSGTFVAWSPDSRYIVIEETSFEGAGEYRISTIELATNRKYPIVVETAASEGTGLNKVGDRFTAFLGLVK